MVGAGRNLKVKLQLLKDTSSIVEHTFQGKNKKKKSMEVAYPFGSTERDH